MKKGLFLEKGERRCRGTKGCVSTRLDDEKNARRRLCAGSPVFWSKTATASEKGSELHLYCSIITSGFLRGGAFFLARKGNRDEDACAAVGHSLITKQIIEVNNQEFIAEALSNHNAAFINLSLPCGRD